MNYKIKDSSIILYDSFDNLEIIKTIPGRKWNKQDKTWEFINSWLMINILNERLGLDIPLPKTSLPESDHKIETKIPLYAHQKISVSIGRQCKGFADLSQPGSGKTRTQIELILERNAYPVLIICPKSIIEAVWQKQLSEFNIRTFILDGGSKKIKEKLYAWRSGNNKKDICIINYESAPLVLDELLKCKFEYIILDESTKIKSPTAKRSKAIMKLRTGTKYRSIMTGTLAPNGLLDAFNQFKFIDNSIFGDSYYAFREHYFYQCGYMGYEWLPKSNALAEFREKIKLISVQHNKRDCVDLPPLVHEERLLDMDAKQAEYYNQMKEQLLLEIGDEVISAPFAVTKLMKLRQIASGFVYVDDEAYAFYTPKLKELLNLINEINNKVIIFVHFKATAYRLNIELTTKKYQPLLFSSQLSGEDKNKMLDDFKNNPDKNILIANTASAAHGLNLQFCSNIIYYEHDFALESYEQSWQRIERIGQENKMTVYHLLMKKTIEPYILKKLKAKIDINKQLDISELKENL